MEFVCLIIIIIISDIFTTDIAVTLLQCVARQYSNDYRLYEYGSLPARTSNSSALHVIQTGSGAHPASYKMGAAAFLVSGADKLA
jgi:hypothetical protein